MGGRDIAVTGSGGYLGRKLCAALIKESAQLIQIRRGHRVECDDRMWRLDLSCRSDIDKLLGIAKHPETVVHLAGHIDIALAAHPQDPERPPVAGLQNQEKLYSDNVQATANIMHYCISAGVKHLIFSSSQTVYGMPRECPLKETSTCAPMEQYSITKLCGEIMLNSAVNQGLNITILRFPGIYGESRKTGVIQGFCRSGLRHGRIVVTADYPLPIDVLHIDDAVNALKRAIAFDGEGANCFNIGTGDPSNLNIFAEEIASLIPGCVVTPSAVWQPVVQLDSSSARDRLLWHPISRVDRFANMIASFNDVG